MTANQNLEALYSYAHFQKINIDKEEYKFQVETHPDYPSLLAFADALTFFNIPNVAFKIPFEEIDAYVEEWNNRSTASGSVILLLGVISRGSSRRHCRRFSRQAL